MELNGRVRSNYRQMPTERLYPSDTAGEDARLGAAATDTVLIERSLTDPEAFRTIWSRHHSSIGRYVASRVGIDSVEDLLVTTFMAAFESRSRFNLNPPIRIGRRE